MLVANLEKLLYGDVSLIFLIGFSQTMAVGLLGAHGCHFAAIRCLEVKNANGNVQILPSLLVDVDALETQLNHDHVPVTRDFDIEVVRFLYITQHVRTCVLPFDTRLKID